MPAVVGGLALRAGAPPLSGLGGKPLFFWRLIPRGGIWSVTWVPEAVSVTTGWPMVSIGRTARSGRVPRGGIASTAEPEESHVWNSKMVSNGGLIRIFSLPCV